MRGRQAVATGLEAKQRTVSQFMTAQQEDIARQREAGEARVGLAGERAEVTGDLASQSFQMFQTLQGRLDTINQLRLTTIQTEADYKN